MYTLTVDGNDLYIPEEKYYSLNSAKIKTNSDRVAYLDFEIPKTNKAYDFLNEKTSTVKVYKDNVLKYKFFVDTIEDDFYFNKLVSCTSVIEYLSDSIVRPYSTIESEPGLLAPSSLDGYFQWLIDQHNAVSDTKKKFYVGVNQGASLDNNNYVYRASTQLPTVSSEIKDKILTPYPSAYITVTFDGEKNIINLYADIHEKNDQVIDFGVNLLDFVKTSDYSKCYTAVRPTGYTPEGSEGNTSTLPITIESIPDGVSKWSSDVYKKKDVVYSLSGVNTWGYRECSYSNTDIKTVDGLYQASVAYLKRVSNPALTIEAKAIDLALLMGDKYSTLQVRQAVRIRATPHNIDTYMTVSSIDIDVLDPTNDLYTLGESYDSLTGQQSAYVARLNASINSAVDVIGSASDAASKLAEAASKKAQEAKEKAETAADAAADAATKADKVTDTANSAVNKAESAVTKADTAISTATDTKAKVTLVEKKATEAKNAADTAKKAADDATTAANSAQSSAAKANEAASSANTAASNAQATADSALSSANKANEDVGSVKTQITEINKEMTSVKQDAATLRDDLSGQITTVKETMEADYAKKSELSDTETNLRTEISKSAAGLRTEVSQTYSTKKELETTTKAAQTAQSTADAAKKAAESNASDLANAVSKFDGDITNLKDQIDGAIQTWFYDGIPNALTEPEVHWTTDKDRQTHLGDLYYDNQTGFCYRYMNQNGVYSWARIQDTDVTKALSDAAKAQGTANAKKRIFVATPTPPYDVGDLWVQGSTGDILRCQTPKIDGQAYAEADWVKASKYTDDTAVTKLSNTVEKTYATKSTVNQLSDKIEQTVSSVEEVRTDASAAKTTADNAKKAADDAAAAANTAHETATAAQTAANTAKEQATSAATAASTAKANADAAQAAANKANAALSDAQKNLTDLQNRADVTDEELTAAKKAVVSAQTAADSANSAASKAKELASTAQSTADTAKANAATAQSKANAAASAASTAQSTADTAKANAKKAQDDVDALKNRVTTAETKITQNSEAIALRATKTEVTSAVNQGLITVLAEQYENTDKTAWIKLNGSTVMNRDNGMSRGVNIVVLNRHTLSVVKRVNYDVYDESDVYPDQAAAYLNSLDSTSIVVIASWDAVGSNAAFDTALYRCGGSKSLRGVGRLAYALIGIPGNGKGTGIESFANTANNGVDVKPYISCRVVDGALIGSNSPSFITSDDAKADATNKANNAISESKKYTDAQLKITSDSITSSVSSTYATKSDLSTTNSNVTKAQNTANSASSAASNAQSTANTASSNASTALSTANTANSTANTVKNDLANLSIGGRNLARGTNMLYNADGIGWSSNGDNIPTLERIDGSWAIKVTKTSNSDKNIPSTVLNNWVLLEWGKTYKYSGEIMITSDFNTFAGSTPLHYWLDTSSTPDIVNPSRKNSTSGLIISSLPHVYMNANTWYKFEYTIATSSTKPADAYKYPMIRCFLYGSNNGTINGYTTAYIINFKVEEGTRSTGWSPAPEDYSTTTEMQSSINQTAESIKSTVAATYVNNQTLSSYATKSQLEQTSTSLTSRIQTTETTVSGMNTTVKQVNNYMTFGSEGGNPTLTIGSSSSSFRTKLTNTSEKFMQGDQTIMELDGVTSTVKASRMQMGHYQWRDTGTSMQLIYIP